MTASTPAGSPERDVEVHDSLAALDAALVVRQSAGWRLLSTGSASPGRWWAEYEREVEPG